jgi:hypothetical protein
MVEFMVDNAQKGSFSDQPAVAVVFADRDRSPLVGKPGSSAGKRYGLARCQPVATPNGIVMITLSAEFQAAPITVWISRLG